MQDEKLSQAFRKAIKYYFEENDFEETTKLKERKYNKKYFDQMETDLISPPDEPKKTKKRRKK